jgi:hypothetical protein
VPESILQRAERDQTIDERAGSRGVIVGQLRLRRGAAGGGAAGG